MKNLLMTSIISFALFGYQNAISSSPTQQYFKLNIENKTSDPKYKLKLYNNQHDKSDQSDYSVMWKPGNKDGTPTYSTHIGKKDNKEYKVNYSIGSVNESGVSSTYKWDIEYGGQNSSDIRVCSVTVKNSIQTPPESTGYSEGLQVTVTISPGAATCSLEDTGESGDAVTDSIQYFYFGSVDKDGTVHLNDHTQDVFVY